jgi:type II secretory pathway pseudopilin PulG
MPPPPSDQVQSSNTSQSQSQSQSQIQSQSQSQGQSRPLSPTPTAGFASRDRMRNAWAGLRDRLGFRPSSPATSPVSPSAVSPPPEPEPQPEPQPEPSPIPSPATPVDPRTQLLADMARAFQMGLDPEDGSGPGSRSGAPSSPAIEVNLGDGQRQQQQTQQQERSPPEDSFERFLMDLQVDLRRTLEDGRPENEPELEQEQGREVSPVGVDAEPLVYPQEPPLSTHGLGSATEALDFSEDLPALPPDDDDLLPSHDEADDDTPVIGNDRQPGLEDEPVTTVSPPAPLSPPPPLPAPPSQLLPVMPPPPTRRTVAGSERRPGGGINWWRMYRFPPMVVPHGTPALGSSPASPLPPPSAAPTTAPTTAPASTSDSSGSSAEAAGPSSEPAPTPTAAADTQTQDGNTVVPVIVVGLQSVHGYGHAHGHRHTEGRDEQHLLQQAQQQAQQQRQQQQDARQDHDHAVQDDTPGQPAETPRDREGERRWSTRAADALRGLQPVHGSGPTSREGSGPSGSEVGDTRAGDDGHGSTTFFIYVIGGKSQTISFCFVVLTMGFLYIK